MGRLDLFAGLEGTSDGGWFGAGVDAEAKVSDKLSAFGTARVGADWDRAGAKLDYSALAGLRVRW